MRKAIVTEPLKKVNLSRRVKFFFACIDSDDRVTTMNKKQFDKLDLPTPEVGELTQKEITLALTKQLQMNQRLEFNMWCKKNAPSFFVKLDKLIEMGAKWTKSGLLSIER
ncbi:hypothetical protein ACTFQF_00165 [Aliivibrio fischeri]|uniref:hypothetical protein n=1 Tax=Aliivibrio fischeri TaxID=668 RepID=UPI0007C5D207|nr:hypothetical protein [Aliivibrio fischeri]MUK37643.1 hypothetical protein [Aliivibrio fischeri]